MTAARKTERRIARRVPGLAAVLALVVAAGCASPPPAPVPAETALLHDRHFAPPDEPVGTDGLFAVDEAMRRHLAAEVQPLLRRLGPQHGLVEALFTRSALQLEYQGSATRTAREAFAARAGNCLSLVVMTAAFARELDLPVRFQSAVVEEAWSREGDLLFESGHVNITLERRASEMRFGTGGPALTIDFLPPGELGRLRVREISESTVESMYMNNRAAEALAQGRIDTAYAWARGSVTRSPEFASAWNTLGVVYLRRGLAAEAAAVFERVASSGDASAQTGVRSRALSNLANAYERLGRPAEASAARQRLAAIDTHPPFHFYRLGRAAAAAGDWSAARAHFAREARRAQHWHEFHYWHGVAAYRLGDLAAAERAFAQAAETSASASDRDRYAGKRAWLRQPEIGAPGRQRPHGPDAVERH